MNVTAPIVTGEQHACMLSFHCDHNVVLHESWSLLLCCCVCCAIDYSDRKYEWEKLEALCDEWQRTKDKIKADKTIMKKLIKDGVIVRDKADVNVNGNSRVNHTLDVDHHPSSIILHRMTLRW